MGERVENSQIKKSSGRAEDTTHALGEAYSPAAFSQLFRDVRAGQQPGGQFPDILDFGAHSALYGEKPQTHLPEHHAHGRHHHHHHHHHSHHSHHNTEHNERNHLGASHRDESEHHDKSRTDVPLPPVRDKQLPTSDKVDHTADGGTKVTDVNGNATTTWADGRTKQENTDSTGFLRKPDGQGGYTEHHWGKLARDNFDVKDVASERNHTADQAEQAFKGRPQELKDFKRHMQEFEERAKKDGLPPEEVAKTYKEIGRLLEAKGDKPLTADERSAIAGQVMQQAANPADVDQGQHKSCNVATVEARTYTRTPSEAARLVTDVATTGHFTAYDGTTVNINPQAHDTSKDRVPADGARSHASEIFQVTAVNLHYAHENAKTNPPGQLRYEQEEPKPGSKDTGERLRDYSTDPPKELDRHPNLPEKALTEVNNTISGKSETDIVLADPKYAYKSPDGIKEIRSEDELNTALAEAKRQGKLPVIVKVNTAMEPFYKDSGAGAAGGSGGAHVVTITDYQPGPPARVKIDNQWGSAADHNRDDNQVSVHDLYNSMHSTHDAIEGLKKDVASDRAHNTVDSLKEFELLRLQKSQGQLTEQEYTDQLTKLVKDTKARWDKQGKDGTLNPDEVMHGKDELQTAISNLDPADKFKVLAAENQVGLITDQQYNHELAASSWRAKYINDQRQANGELTDADKKKYEDFMKAFDEALAALPKERQLAVLDQIKGWMTYEQMQARKK